MNDDFWLAKWRKGQLGFHQAEVNARLLRHGARLGEAARVLVPLSGKSKDMKWLLDQGHEVVAIELAEEALEAFFAAHGLPYERRSDGVFVGERIEAWPNNIFDLSTEQLGTFDAIFDRAALVAIAPEERRRYADLLLSLLRPNGRLLLVTFDYDQSKMDGPPFAVKPDTVQALFGSRSVECLDKSSVLDDNGKFAQRGLDWLDEAAWLIV